MNYQIKRIIYLLKLKRTKIKNKFSTILKEFQIWAIY